LRGEEGVWNGDAKVISQKQKEDIDGKQNMGKEGVGLERLAWGLVGRSIIIIIAAVVDLISVVESGGGSGEVDGVGSIEPNEGCRYAHYDDQYLHQVVGKDPQEGENSPKGGR